MYPGGHIWPSSLGYYLGALRTPIPYYLGCYSVCMVPHPVLLRVCEAVPPWRTTGEVCVRAVPPSRTTLSVLTAVTPSRTTSL